MGTVPIGIQVVMVVAAVVLFSYALYPWHARQRLRAGHFLGLALGGVVLAWTALQGLVLTYAWVEPQGVLVAALAVLVYLGILYALLNVIFGFMLDFIWPQVM